jgi:hypothetical protein
VAHGTACRRREIAKHLSLAFLAQWQVSLPSDISSRDDSP